MAVNSAGSNTSDVMGYKHFEVYGLTSTLTLSPSTVIGNSASDVMGYTHNISSNSRFKICTTDIYIIFTAYTNYYIDGRLLQSANVLIINCLQFLRH